MMRISTSPSLSKSPNAQPRLEYISHRRTAHSGQFFEGSVSQIAKDQARARIMLLLFGIDAACHPEDIRAAVVIQVRRAHAPADVPRFHAQTGADRGVRKLALAVVHV